MIGDYKSYINRKRTYLKRKKQLNREIKYFKKKIPRCKRLGRRYFSKVVERKKDSIDRLNIMYRYYKRINKRRKYKFY